MAAPKKYGLILPKSKQGPMVQKAATSNVFGEDSDDEHSKSNIEVMIKKESKRNLNRLDTQLTMQKALDQDASVFEYDEIYDDMKAKKEEEELSNKVISKDRKPKYIDHLLRNAAARKKEEERRQQRKIQKEREEEKEEFGDKEAFVTSSYKKKMDEMKREEEEAKRKEQLEEMMDVTKQKDLSGFYRHLLKQQCGEEKIPDRSSGIAKDETENQVTPPQSRATKSEFAPENLDADSDIELSSDEESTQKPKAKQLTRTYRKRKQQSDSEEEPTNVDDRSIEESSSASESEEEDKSTKVNEPVTPEKSSIIEKPEPQLRSPKDWRKMFEKRCVAEKFVAAREKYLLRWEARRGAAVQ